jgi:hypothetical protein
MDYAGPFQTRVTPALAEAGIDVAGPELDGFCAPTIRRVRRMCSPFFRWRAVRATMLVGMTAAN